MTGSNDPNISAIPLVDRLRGQNTIDTKVKSIW